MKTFQCLIKLKLLLLLIVASVTADCDICIATFNTKSCEDQQVCSYVQFSCFDGENSEADCEQPEYVPMLIKTENQSSCEQPETTPSTPLDPDGICEQAQKQGAVPDSRDSTCTKFIVCFNSNQKWLGIPRSCADGMYFNKDREICQFNKPDNCA